MVVKSKRGLSAVIAIVIMVLLVTVTAAIVWGIVNGIVRENTQGVESCFDVSFDEKVILNSDYTCYNSSSKKVQFSVNVGDVDIDALIVSIAGISSSKSFTITNDATEIADLENYGSDSLEIKLPGKNAGLTYLAIGFEDKPDQIKIAPIIDEKQCDATDTLFELDDCSFLVSG